jgi:hypothetical protein
VCIDVLYGDVLSRRRFVCVCECEGINLFRLVVFQDLKANNYVLKWSRWKRV